ncbi:hypothetical protein GCM10010869_25440 [Mesorhizobium tianshanense]|nr:hypothetical protein GCM10010869_25440 [Mesorhizobium tianshanense]
MIAAGYEDGNDANRLRSDPVFKMAQDALADHVGQAVDHLVRAARIIDAARKTLSHTQLLFHLRQSENAAVGRQHAAVETGDDGLAADR